MKKILCFLALGMLSTQLLSCKGKSLIPETTPAPVAPPAKPQVANAVLPCAKYGSTLNFNDQRIVAFQKLVQLQILRIKALEMTQESTEALAQLELLRRRVSYPLLTSSLRPQVVTKILLKESQVFVALLEQRKNTDPQAMSLLEEVNERFMPLVDNQDQWNCLERQTDFNEDPIKTELID